MKQKALAVFLSKLENFQQPLIKDEQYQTDSEIAADILWHAFLQGDIQGKIIADFGCGNGVFGIGALYLGAKQVYFVDTDKKMIALAKKNYVDNALAHGVFLTQDVTLFNAPVDVVFQNPPFGVQKKGADRIFLEKAFQVSKKIYSLHKIVTRDFIDQFITQHGWRGSLIKVYDFPLKKILPHHKKKVYYTQVGLWRMELFQKV